MLDKIMAIIQSKNLFTMDTNLYITPAEFHSAYIVETIIHYIILGDIKNRFPGFLLSFLQLDHQYYISAPPNLELQLWPFANIYITTDDKVGIISPETYRDNLSRMVNSNLTHKCNTLLEIRHSYKVAHSQGNVQLCEEIVKKKLCSEMISLVLLFQMRLSNVNITHDITLSMLINEPLDVHTRIVYFNSTQFLQKMSAKVAKLTRNYNENHMQLFEIFDTIRTEFIYPRGINFDLHLCNFIDATIQSEKSPLRFSYGRFVEYVIILDTATFPIPSASKLTFERAVKFSNRGRINHHPTLTLNGMMATVFEWSEQTQTRIKLKTIATAIQYLFEDGLIPDDFRMNNTLKHLLNYGSNSNLLG
jgi:hypothetical protein